MREFTREPVDEAKLAELTDAAIQAPSAMNRQSWRFSILEDRALLAGISAECKKHMLASSPMGLISHHFTELLGDSSFDIFYGAPILIVISSRTDSRWVTEDCALAAEDLMLAACGLGLGTCWIGFAQAWLATATGKSVLELSQDYLPVAPIIVGYRKSAPPAVLRRKPDIHWIGTHQADWNPKSL